MATAIPPGAIAASICGDDPLPLAERQDREEVAERIRAGVASSGMTSAGFAAHVETSASRLSTYCRGTVTPSAAMLLRIERLAGDGPTDSERSRPAPERRRPRQAG